MKVLIYLLPTDDTGFMVAVHGTGWRQRPGQLQRYLNYEWGDPDMCKRVLADVLRALGEFERLWMS